MNLMIGYNYDFEGNLVIYDFEVFLMIYRLKGILVNLSTREL